MLSNLQVFYTQFPLKIVKILLTRNHLQQKKLTKFIYQEDKFLIFCTQTVALSGNNNPTSYDTELATTLFYIYTLHSVFLC